MAHERRLYPKLFDNEKMATLPFSVRYFYIGLWCYADVSGRLEDRPAKLKKLILGYDNLSVEDVDKGLDDLQKAGFIIRYEAEKNQFIQIVNFSKYQPAMNEDASIIPCPEGYQPPEFCGEQTTMQLPQKPKKKPKQKEVPIEELHVGENPFEVFPMKDGSEYPIYNSLIIEFEKTYPNVDVPGEIRKMKSWLNCNPSKRKTQVGIKSFMNSWLNRADGSSKKHTSSRNTVDAIQKAYDDLNMFTQTVDR